MQQSQRGACHKNVLIRKHQAEPHPLQRQRLQLPRLARHGQNALSHVLFFILDNFPDSSAYSMDYATDINDHGK